MSIFNDMLSGIKNNLQWHATSAVIGEVDKGVSSVVKSVTTRCPQCHKPITEQNAVFCPNCRASLVLICQNPNCGRQAPLGTKFCPSCGSKLKPTKSIEETQSTSPVTTPPPAPTETPTTTTPAA